MVKERKKEWKEKNELLEREIKILNLFGCFVYLRNRMIGGGGGILILDGEGEN